MCLVMMPQLGAIQDRQCGTFVQLMFNILKRVELTGS